MGISMETFLRKEGKKTRERDFGLSKNHCTQWRHLETRDRLDRVKKQFSFPWPAGSDCIVTTVTYRLPRFRQSNSDSIFVERTTDRVRGKRAAMLGRRSKGSAPERAKN